MKHIIFIFLLLAIGISSHAQHNEDWVVVAWDEWDIEFKIPPYLDIELKSEEEIIASGDGLKIQLTHVGQMAVREELGFFDQLLELDFKDPVEILPNPIPAILIGGYSDRIRVLIMAFNLEDQNAFVSISFFDEDNADKELEVLEIYKSFKAKK